MNKLVMILGTIGIGAAVIYLGLVVYLAVNQAKMIYLPSPDINLTPTNIGLAFDDITFYAEDNTGLNGWFIPAENSIGTILFCHGNGGNISGRLETIRLFNEMGLSIFIFDYRGYGRSDGEPSEKGTYKDARAAWNYLVAEKGIVGSKIIIIGRSLGGAIAAHLAREVSPAGLIIESAFKSVKSLGGELYPFFPIKLISRFNYNTASYIRKVKCPILVVHSPEDDIIPFHHGREIYQSAPEPKQFLEITGNHNDGFLLSGDCYLNGIEIFIKRNLND
ncbi:MAG: alpha/beta hydrolase [bacterium]